MASWSNLSQKDRRLARDNYLSSLKFPAEKKAEAWSAYQKLSDEQKKKLAESEAKKKPTAASAPTLQQHPIKQKPTLTPSTPADNNASPASPEPSSTNNSRITQLITKPLYDSRGIKRITLTPILASHIL